MNGLEAGEHDLWLHSTRHACPTSWQCVYFCTEKVTAAKWLAYFQEHESREVTFIKYIQAGCHRIWAISWYLP